MPTEKPEEPHVSPALQEAAEPWVPGGPPPKTAAEVEGPSVLPGAPFERLARIIPRGPLRRLLATHEVHIFPHRVAHVRRARRVASAVLVAVLLFSAWYWVIPRTDVRVQVQYHEGLFNAIAVDIRIINDGTVALAPLHVELVVADEATHAAMGFFNNTTSLAAHRTYNPGAVEFKGDEVSTNYTISLLVSFTAGATRATRTFDFRTEEPFMNLYFEGRVA